MMQTTNRYPVQSTNIVSLGYDEAHEILEIEFKRHIIRQYFEVPLSQFVAIMKAEYIDDFYDNYVNCRYHFDEMRLFFYAFTVSRKIVIFNGFKFGI